MNTLATGFQIQAGHYLMLSAIFFGLGALGFLLRRNMLVQLMCIELMLNAVNFAFVSLNRFMPTAHTGQLFVFFIIAVAAAEAAIGLAIILSFYRLKKSVYVDQAASLKH